MCLKEGQGADHFLLQHSNDDVGRPSATAALARDGSEREQPHRSASISVAARSSTLWLGDAPHEYCSRLLCRPQVRPLALFRCSLLTPPRDSTKTTTWDDPRLPSSLDQNVPQYKRDFRRKLIYFRSQPALRPSPGQCHVKIRRSHIFEDSYAEIMRQSANDLKKRLMIKFDGEDGLDYGGLSRCVGSMVVLAKRS